jgi:putative methionine-R-sulfoxide reductase with GAF domain
VRRALIRGATVGRWVGIYTVTDSQVINEAWSGPGPPAFPTFPLTAGLTAHALRARSTALSNDVGNDPRYLSNQNDSGSELIVPVLRGGRVVGTLDVESAEVGAFTGEAVLHCEQLAELLAD